MNLQDRLADPNNMNPLFQRILALSTAYHKRLTKKIIETRTTIGSIIGGSVLGEILEMEPNLTKLEKSKSALKWMLGNYGGNIEVWSSPSGRKLLMITNGYGRRDKKHFKVETIIPVRKFEGIWVEWHESIKT
mgnify:FL=1